ncbi:MAG TPA: hypothetical protein VFC78_22160 [Tepidisphaeraceae bacterium]|nr:hypothetical protein [Tepidisphaeraceae bacterium]
MTADNLWQRLRLKPFAPFRLHLSGGTFYDIRHPEMMLVTRTGITVALYETGQSGDEPAAREALISFLHVTSTEDLPTSTRAAG